MRSPVKAFPRNLGSGLPLPFAIAKDKPKWRLELELIQTQMAQKPMPREKVYAHAMRASQNRKKEVRREKEVQYFQPSLKWKLFMNKFGSRLRSLRRLFLH